ncbi:MAG: hypothetical protein LBC03_04895, partial [Nitrososphaerota archaeon]|nr:hypothetical protein [Nitrososphaerota archaeon]
MVDVSFTPSERKVYLLSLEYSPLEFKQISHGDISKCTQVPVKNIPKVLKSIDKKISVSARYDELRFLVSKYFRILQLTQSHYKEENRKNTHVFNIDFSELYAYLNPREALDEQKNIIFDNIGSIYYMFNSKQKKHTYCMLPPAIWELINKLYVRRMTVDQINYDDFNNNNEKMKDFYELINDWKGKYPATFSSELMSRYNAMGKGRSVVNTLNTLVLTKQGELEKRLKYNRSTLKEMF